MTEGSGSGAGSESGSIPLSYGSGSGTRRPINTWIRVDSDPQHCLKLLLLARQRDVEELLLLANVTERGADVPLKVVPLEAKLFRRHCVGGVAVGSLAGKGLYEQVRT
jgi:hypothetical protein